MALVEYTKKRIFLGVINGSRMTFAKKPVGNISDSGELHFEDNQCLTLKPQDIMEIDKNYLIATVPGKKSDNRLILTEMAIQEIKNQMKTYVTKNKIK